MDAGSARSSDALVFCASPCRASSAGISRSPGPNTASLTLCLSWVRWERWRMEWWTTRWSTLISGRMIVIPHPNRPSVFLLTSSDGALYHKPCWQGGVHPFFGPIFWSKSYARVRDPSSSVFTDQSCWFTDLFMLFSREGQPLKLPETKKTLLFTFNGDYSHLLSVNPTSSAHRVKRTSGFCAQCPAWATRLPETWTRCSPSWTWWSTASIKSRSCVSTERWAALSLHHWKVQQQVYVLLLCVQGKQKADRNRARVEENFLKQTHAQRQEAAQTRREEKKRAEKERIMNEEDPERQRRMEVWDGDPGLGWKRAFEANTEQLRVKPLFCCVARRQLSDGSRRRWRRSRWRWSRSKWRPCEGPSSLKCLNAVWKLPVRKWTDPCCSLVFIVAREKLLQPPLTISSGKLHLWPFGCSSHSIWTFLEAGRCQWCSVPNVIFFFSARLHSRSSCRHICASGCVYLNCLWCLLMVWQS